MRRPTRSVRSSAVNPIQRVLLRLPAEDVLCSATAGSRAAARNRVYAIPAICRRARGRTMPVAAEAGLAVVIAGIPRSEDTAPGHNTSPNNTSPTFVGDQTPPATAGSLLSIGAKITRRSSCFGVTIGRRRCEERVGGARIGRPCREPQRQRGSDRHSVRDIVSWRRRCC
jgi:hypothetical protein